MIPYIYAKNCAAPILLHPNKDTQFIDMLVHFICMSNIPLYNTLKTISIQM